MSIRAGIDQQAVVSSFYIQLQREINNTGSPTNSQMKKLLPSVCGSICHACTTTHRGLHCVLVASMINYNTNWSQSVVIASVKISTATEEGSNDVNPAEFGSMKC
ncbi:hypothetical protein Pdw03_2043 [Penicillium digitatum]|uniref:Uncharacterized protein n=1 Tax=Penicillium digitatum TaxID=36651 RepID=A0A7T6XTH7_PENDI|nr:hypothetical protein Pdw03_2043 [Penicillium digitatum]